jgi:hypothetical protein
MLVHSVTLTALLCPLVAYLLCQRFDLRDPINLSMMEAASWSFGGLLLWLRSRYLASTYLTERQNRKILYVSAARRDVEATARGGDMNDVATKDDASAQQRSLRTVARLAPVLPAFLACCFVLLSFFCLMSAVLHTIWIVRSEAPEL